MYSRRFERSDADEAFAKVELAYKLSSMLIRSGASAKRRLRDCLGPISAGFQSDAGAT